MKKNIKKYLIPIVIISVLIIGGIITFIFINKDKEGDNPMKNGNDVGQIIRVKGKLLDYLNKLSNNYYIKYMGTFNDGGKTIQASVEYTELNRRYALHSNELDMHVIFDGTNLFSISNKYKIVVQMKESGFDVSKYNLVSDIGQIFVKEGKEKVGEIYYDFEEYRFENKKLKYYFSGNDLKLINYDGNQIRIVRVQTSANEEMFNIPNDYEQLKA